MEKKKTIRKSVSVEGIGLHTGQKVRMMFKPASANSGIAFIRTDLPNRPRIEAHLDNVVKDIIPRCTSIGKDGAYIYTIEHLMSVLYGLGIDNLDIEIDSQEVPGLDGSGLNFLKLLKESGLKEQEAERRYFEIREPIWVEKDGSTLLGLPSSGLKISYLLDYSHTGIQAQFINLKICADTFEREVAPSRTFCLENEAELLKKSGLGKGANYENTLVISEKGVKNNTVRFENELARHKILDFVGDVYLLGLPIKAQVFAVKSGHALNLAFLKKVAEQIRKYQEQSVKNFISFDQETILDIKKIMSILPHRYPFLLVDRVIDLQSGKKAVGIKNVTVNDQFFNGHFPSRPIMPGVLMVEAMAQVAGIALLTDPQHSSQWALFMAANNVKFRKMVVPGDQLIMEAEIMRMRSKIAQAHGTVRVNGEVVAETDLVFSFMEEDFLRT